ncbi:MAG: hypothetical protein HY984_02375, partial [Candidatus Magasanikbacteria bacterium]|nr:hypothetical protein [Candidatus Magasanikbacteria bacterium]
MAKDTKTGVPVPPPPVKVATMPEAFFPKVEKKSFPVSLVFGIMAVVLVAIVGAIYMFSRSIAPANQPVAQTNENIPDLNVNNAPPLPVNQNLNTNVNTNVNTNANVNTPVITPPQPPRAPWPQFLASTQDTDQDKLTDLEEDVYGTDPKRPDTDGDGHLDGNEVLNMFDPTKLAPAKLDENEALVTKFTDEKWNYSIFYPTKWVARAVDGEKREVMFTSAVGEFVDVLVQDNPDKLPVADWYAKQTSGVSASQVSVFTTKRGMKAAVSQDGLTVYLEPDQIDPGTV